MQGEQQVLDRGATRQEEHLLLRVRALGVGVRMRTPEGHPRDDQDRSLTEHRVAPRDPSLDHVFRRPVPAKILSPGLRDRRQQPATGRLAREHRESPRPRVVRRRSGARRSDRLLERVVRNVTGSERADRPARMEGLHRRFAEQIGLRRADQVGAAPVGRCARRRAADERDGDARRLAHREPARGGDLVGERDDGRVQDASGVVGRPAEVDQRGESGHADRDVDDAFAPRASERVGDHDREPAESQRRAERGAQPLGRAVRVLREQRHASVLDVGHVDAGVRTHEAVARRGDREIAATRHHALGLAFHPRRAIAVGNDASLRLRHDLLGHDDDVAVARAERAQRLLQDRCQIVARPDDRQSLDGQDLDAHRPRLTRSGRARRGRRPRPGRRRS